jgi:hypothetical protein
VSGSPEPAKTPEFPPTPFLSPRNVPFWFSVLLVVAVGGLVWWTH